MTVRAHELTRVQRMALRVLATAFAFGRTVRPGWRTSTPTAERPTVHLRVAHGLVERGLAAWQTGGVVTLTDQGLELAEQLDGPAVPNPASGDLRARCGRCGCVLAPPIDRRNRTVCAVCLAKGER